MIAASRALAPSVVGKLIHTRVPCPLPPPQPSFLFFLLLLLLLRWGVCDWWGVAPGSSSTMVAAGPPRSGRLAVSAWQPKCAPWPSTESPQYLKDPLKGDPLKGDPLKVNGNKRARPGYQSGVPP